MNISINHNDAIELEFLVRKLYRCDRGGISGLCDADYFQHNPFQAAILIVAYLYAKGLENEPYVYKEFLDHYETIFDSLQTNDESIKIKDYIKELKQIVSRDGFSLI